MYRFVHVSELLLRGLMNLTRGKFGAGHAKFRSVKWKHYSVVPYRIDETRRKTSRRPYLVHHFEIANTDTPT